MNIFKRPQFLFGNTENICNSIPFMILIQNDIDYQHSDNQRISKL